jgi:type II secretory pathway predicted ATPase ExeA
VLRGLDKQTSVSRIVNTMLDPRELIEAVMLDYGLDPGQGRSKPLLLRDLARFLVDQRMARRLALLVVDEAQNLSPAALEEVRMLSNLETEKSKLVQVVLIGQPNLRDVLATPELEQLRQRITVSYHLRPLGADETAAYVNHRLRRAAAGVPLQFSPEVTSLIHANSQGVPRKINIIADAILLFGYGEDRHVIDRDLTAQVLEELAATGVLAKPVTETSVTAPASPERNARPSAPLPLSATPPPPTNVDTAAIAARERDLAMREAKILEREQQLAEQRRVLMEGFDLVRSRREAANATARPAVDRTQAAVWPPARPAPSATAFAASPTPAAIAPVHEDGFWSRLRRNLFGSPKPAFED